MQGYPVGKATTTLNLVFMMVQSTDHNTALTGASPTVTIQKPGGTFNSPAGAVSEIANGFYMVAANATDNGTAGPLLLSATATNGDTVSALYLVQAVDPTLDIVPPTA